MIKYVHMESNLIPP